MVKYIFNRLKRVPLPAIGLLLFSIIISMLICGLEKSNNLEQEKYDETFNTIPVKITITNLFGTSYKDLNISMLFWEAFETEEELGQYVENVQKVIMKPIDGIYSSNSLYGITSTELSPELSPENGTTINWYKGYDESIFSSNDSLCLIPESLITQFDDKSNQEYIELYFKYWSSHVNPIEYTCRLNVAGTYSGGNGKIIYTPYSICENVFENLDEIIYVQSLQATLANNELLDSFKEFSKKYFTEPKPTGEKTFYGENGYEYYPYALDIDDKQLIEASNTLQNSIIINRVCSILILCLSALSGLLIGFLLVRSRKKEIIIMKTLGTSNITIYLGFVFEQMMLFVIGIIIGGSYNLWKPFEKLIVLPVLFMLGLTIALLIYLQKKLIRSTKEED